jgi:hypothetical protein
MTSPVARALLALSISAHALLQAQEPTVETRRPESPASPAASDTAAIIETLGADQLDEVLTLLRDHFIKPEMLGDLPLKRATVLGAIQRLAPGASILQAPTAEAAMASPFRSEIIDQRIGYARLGEATPANVAELDAALEKFNAAKLRSLVLDLRATPGTSDFAQMAEVCRRFAPKGKVLFSVRKANDTQEQVLTSREEPRFRGVLIVLTDRENAGTPEVIAAVLRSHVNALIIGQQTRGEAVEFARFPLPGGAILRIAVAEVALPDKESIFPGGVKPDVPVEVPRETTLAVLKQGLEKGVSELVFETERVRMNEAALVAGTNPELEAALAAQQSKAAKTKPPLRDPVLQRAVDFITTLAIYEKGRPGK